MNASWRISRIAGSDFDVHPSWLLILALLTLSLATRWLPALAPGYASWVYWVGGGVTALLLFASVLAHEFAHALLARTHGSPVSRSTLFIFGGVSTIERDLGSAGTEFQTAFLGPLTSLQIAQLSWLLAAAVVRSAPLLGAMLHFLTLANLLLGVFNLIPAFPLDGSRALRAIVWKLTGSCDAATRVAVRAGQIVALLFIFVGGSIMVHSVILDGVWVAFIGVFFLLSTPTQN
jgi:Zn-dependent protease